MNPRRATVVSAMTLIELLVVIVILGMLAVALSVGLGGKIGTANREIALIQIRELADHVELYKQHHRKLPPAGDLQQLTSPAAMPEAVYWVDGKKLVDPWGNPYALLVPGPQGHPFEIVSYGADGAPGGTGEEADLSSVTSSE